VLWEREVVLGIAEEAESASTHPLAIAIRALCRAQGATRAEASAFEETPGRGLKVTFASRGCTAAIGNERWMDNVGAAIPDEVAARLGAWKAGGNSIVLLALRRDSDATAATTINQFELVACFAISDPLRAHARGVVENLQSRGLETWMISGDNVITAQAVAQQVGIPAGNVIAGVLPHEKVRFSLVGSPMRECNTDVWHNRLKRFSGCRRCTRRGMRTRSGVRG
jgi:Cu+-exporting ATPase